MEYTNEHQAPETIVPGLAMEVPRPGNPGGWSFPHEVLAPVLADLKRQLELRQAMH